MKIELFLSPGEAERTGCFLARHPGAVGSSELFRGSVLLMEGDHCGHCLFFERVSLVDFCHDTKKFLVEHKSLRQAEATICDANQTYSIRILKQNEMLTLEAHFNRQSRQMCSATFDYAKFLHRLRFVSQQLFQDMVSACPEFRSYNGLQGIQKMMM